MSNIRLDDRVVVVTGAGGGLGRAHALLLGELGACVVVNDLGGDPTGQGATTGPADAVASEIRERGGRAVASHDSVITQQGAAAIVRRAVDTYGRLDAVVNNAGILRDRSIGKLQPQDVDLVLDVHLKGSLYVSQAAFPVMRDAGHGRFVHTSSAAGLFGNFGQANYASAKMGVVGLSRVLAEEGARFGITSNVIAPAARTRLTEKLLGPLNEHLHPECVSPLVAYLVSEECEANREVISVGGGRFARVFQGLTPGWFAGPGVVPSVDDIAAHWEQVTDPEGFTEPASATDELAVFAALLTDGDTSNIAIGAR